MSVCANCRHKIQMPASISQPKQSQVRPRWMPARVTLCWFPVHKIQSDWSKTCFCSEPRCEGWCWCRPCGDELAVQLMDEPGPRCLGAAVHIVIWLLTSSTFCQTVLTAIVFTGAPTYQGKLIFQCCWQNFLSWACLNGQILISARMHAPFSTWLSTKTETAVKKGEKVGKKSVSQRPKSSNVLFCWDSKNQSSIWFCYESTCWLMGSWLQLYTAFWS